MSEALRYEELLARIKALEARVLDLEAAQGDSLTETEALQEWEQFLLSAPIPAITRCWRDLETLDLHASIVGLSDAAKEKLRQSMTKNAWTLLEEEAALDATRHLAHAARLRVLRIVRQLEEMGELTLPREGVA
jgi:hypothetical protein